VGGACGTFGEKVHLYMRLVGKPKKRDHLIDIDENWEDNIEIDFKVVEWKGVEMNHWLKIVRSVRDCCENCSEHLVSITFEGCLV
jgi:endo-alpha-1,4-polygalactosaminidase (GH114 family)